LPILKLTTVLQAEITLALGDIAARAARAG
jgi:hypothetical protein